MLAGPRRDDAGRSVVRVRQDSKGARRAAPDDGATF